MSVGHAYEVVWTVLNEAASRFDLLRGKGYGEAATTSRSAEKVISSRLGIEGEGRGGHGMVMVMNERD